jgi:methionyl-tRNA synthetase
MMEDEIAGTCEECGYEHDEIVECEHCFMHLCLTCLMEHESHEI